MGLSLAPSLGGGDFGEEMQILALVVNMFSPATRISLEVQLDPLALLSDFVVLLNVDGPSNFLHLHPI